MDLSSLYRKHIVAVKHGPVALEVGMLIIAQSEANYICSEEPKETLCQNSEALLDTERLNAKGHLFLALKCMKPD